MHPINLFYICKQCEFDNVIVTHWVLLYDNVVEDMAEFANTVGSSEPSFAPISQQSHSSSGSLRRHGGDAFFGDQVVCPTCRGAGHITHGLLL